MENLDDSGYTVNKMLYSIPTEQDIEYVKTVCKTRFDDPEMLLEIWLYHGLLYGPKLIEPMLEHFKTLSDEDMPVNYIEDVITEFLERLDLKLFNIQNKRFRLIKKNDAVAKEFSRELGIRNESYQVAEEVLINLGYRKKEINFALREIFNTISDLNDSEQILRKAITILNE